MPLTFPLAPLDGFPSEGPLMGSGTPSYRNTVAGAPGPRARFGRGFGGLGRGYRSLLVVTTGRGGEEGSTRRRWGVESFLITPHNLADPT